MTRAALGSPFLPLIIWSFVGCGKAHEHSSNGKDKRADSGVDAGLTVIDPASGLPVVLPTTDHLPDTFPKAIPPYPGAKIVGVVTSNDSGRKMTLVTLFTPDPALTVDDFYRTHVKGMQTVRETGDADTHTRVLEDPVAKLKVTIVATRSGPGTTVQITTSEG